MASITIPKSVVSIGRNVFYGCKKLKKITVKTSLLEKVVLNPNAKIKCPKQYVKTYGNV